MAPACGCAILIFGFVIITNPYANDKSNGLQISYSSSRWDKDGWDFLLAFMAFISGYRWLDYIAWDATGAGDGESYV